MAIIRDIRDAGEIEYHIRVKDVHEDMFKVVRFDGFEAISELFDFEMELVSDDPDIAFDSVVGKPVSLTLRGKLIDGAEEDPRYLHGMVVGLEQGKIGERLTTYFMKIAPRLWVLQNRVDTRIFHKMTVPAIVKKVCKNAKLPANGLKDALKVTYPEREYCVQYQESDWNFIARLLEEEGISFFFDHTKEDHILVMVDEGSAYPEIVADSEIPYRDASGQQSGEDLITDFRFTQTVRKGAVMLRDFNFTKPQANLDASSQSDSDVDLAHFEFPGNYQIAADGKRLAKVRLEEQRATRRISRGVGAVRSFASGRRFSLVDHGRLDLNRDWLLTRVEHHGYEPQSLGQDAPTTSGDAGEPKYKNEFHCIPADVPFRPDRTTPKPHIRGTQSAVVVGPKDEEIYTDEYGRVKVHFHWDRHAAADEHSSCWIRVSQTWAGAGWGSSYIPRIGHEVLVSFLNGDPDQPYLVGSLYNNTQMPPYSLPDEKTKSTIKSASTPGAEGFNELRFEDKAGEEEIYIHAQKTLQLKVQEDQIEQIERDAHLTVVGEQLKTIHKERHTTIGSHDVMEITEDRNLNVVGKQAIEIGGSHSFNVIGNVIEEIGEDHSEQVTGNYFVKAMGITIEAQSGITLKCGGNSIVIDPGGVTIKGSIVTVDGSMVKIASGPGSSPQSGSAGSLVAPASVRAPSEVEDPDPGRASEARAKQVETGTGRYGSAPVVSWVPSDDEVDDEEHTFIEIELLDEEDNPVPGAAYEITLPDGERVSRGTLDENGYARVEGIDPGECSVTFPDLDEEAWEPS